MSDLVMRAAELLAVAIKEQTAQVRSERDQALKLYDRALPLTLDELGAFPGEGVVAAARRVAAERDAARAELAGVAAQRDAHLTRSVELAARVTELEARLAAVAPVDAAEVDGFRVGDLVEHKLDRGRYTRVSKLYISDRDPCCVGIYTISGPQSPSTLTRKPVEVGDTVRCGVMGRGKVLGIYGGGGDAELAVPRCHVKLDDVREVYVCPSDDCIAVAP